MANQLTGDFDIVAQAGIEVLNRVARSMHQNGAKDPGLGLPVLPHRLALHVVDTSAGQPVSGSAFVQVGVRHDPPVLQLVAGAPSDVRLRVPIRARYYPDPGTQPLPEFLFGEVRARYAITLEAESGVLGFRPVASPDDSEIAFVSQSGGKIGNVSGIVRHLVRSGLHAFLPLPDDLQGSPPILRGLVDSSGAQAVALPVSLSGSEGDPASVTRVFTASNGVAIGVGEEFILAPIRTQLEYLKAHPPSFTVEAVGYDVADYSVTITKATAEWSDGFVITITIKGKAHTDSILPDASFEVTLKLRLTFPPGGIAVERVGSPSVSVSVGGSLPGFVKAKVERTAKGIVTRRVSRERDKALAQANPLLAQAFAQTDLLGVLLRRIDEKASVWFSEATFDPDGFILPGLVRLSPSKLEQVEFAQLPGGTGYTAFDSWIPGGWIEGFHWTWYGPSGVEPEKIQERILKDRFVLEEKGLPVKQASTGQGGIMLFPVFAQVCLRLIQASGGETLPARLFPDRVCRFDEYVPRKEQIYPPKLPVKWPDPAGRLRFVGHVDPVGAGHLGSRGSNLLVQRVAREPVAAAVRRIEASARSAGLPEASLAVALVIPAGSFARVAAEFSHVRSRRRPGGNITLLALEDEGGSWSRAFDLPASGRSSELRLVDPDGQLVWQHDGRPDERTLTDALRKHLRAAAPPATELVGAGVRAGQAAPDFHFDGVSGGRLALRWLRGRVVVLVFAEAEASPSLRALKQLKRLERSAERYGLFPLAVLDGTRRKAAMVRRDLRLGCPVVPDPDGMISRRYGIRCWPTTVVIDRDGQVANVSLGAG